MGVLGDGEFALFVAQFAVVVIINRHILVKIIVFPYGFCIPQWRLRFLVDPAFKFVADFIGPIKALDCFAFNTQVVGGFSVDNGWVGVDKHGNNAGIDGTIVNAVLEGFSRLIGKVVDFSTEHYIRGLFVGGQGG